MRILTHASLALEIRMNISSAASLHGTVCPIRAQAFSDAPGFLSGCLEDNNDQEPLVRNVACQRSAESQHVADVPCFALFTVCFFDLIFLGSFLRRRRCGRISRCERHGSQVRAIITRSENKRERHR